MKPMHVLLVVQLLALLLVANGAPILAARVLGHILETPLDGGSAFADGRPLFGSSKTLRGVTVSLVATTIAAPLVGLPGRSERWWRLPP
jgi:CDP-2,3-bis-(O-geranylgeranyl)-sn-glycerol synthase